MTLLNKHVSNNTITNNNNIISLETELYVNDHKGDWSRRDCSRSFQKFAWWIPLSQPLRGTPPILNISHIFCRS